MFKWISDAFENTRIAWSFPDYEKARREEHLAAADRRFPTEKLEREIAELAKAPSREAALKFGPTAAALRAEIAADRERDRVLRQKLAVFERNYKKELDDLYLKLGEAKEALDELYEEKNEAHKAFNDAKSSIDHWYRMSNCYLGNRGREIPKSRIFGRSQNDLDHYKSEKSSAARTIARLREEIEDTKDDKVRYFKEVTALKALRQQMFDLKTGGASAAGLKSAISENGSSLSKREARLGTIEGERAAFLAQSRMALGIPEREQDVQRIKMARQAFIQSFESSASVAQRKEQHRREWRARHSA